MKRFFSVLAGLAFSTSTCLFAADDKPPIPPPAPKPTNGIKPYSEVITANAKSDTAMFIVHRIEDKMFYEIPVKELNQELLWVTRVAKTPQIGYGGEEANREVVKWERKFNKIYLRTLNYGNIAADSLPISRSVKASNFEEIIAAFPIAAFNKDSSTVVIDVTSLFTTDITVFGINRRTRDQYKISMLDANRSYIDQVFNFPTNIEVENVLTYSAENPPQNYDSKTVTVTMHHSMLRLPEKKMQPRLADERVGFFSIAKTDYGLPVQRAESRRYIVRWRLEPKDPAAFERGELVEPVKPITFYIDPATPTQWIPYLKKGVESWKSAFEQAGFKNAIRCIDAPSPKEDPKWSPEDARYSVIRYYSSPIQNAYGPNTNDPRTGEILEADIGWFHNIMNLQRNWYFTQAVADPRSHKLPLSDSLMGELVAYVAAHEVGHSLGLMHNMKASSSYPVDSLRSKTFTEEYGVAPSIMDYARFNYVAQPGDGAALMPKIGPYDKFAIRWGYRPIPQAKSSEEELPTLNQWAKAQDANKMLRFHADQFLITDPTAQMEDLGDDAVAATRYGLKNIERIMGYIFDAPAKDGVSYDELEELYLVTLGQWRTELGHVANNVGGMESVFKRYGQEGVVYKPISEQKQREALQFLAENAFQTPTMFIREDLLRRFEPSGSAKRLMDNQSSLLRSVLRNEKLLRLLEQESLKPDSSYTVAELFADCETLLFSELKQASLKVDPYRRALQRAFVADMGEKLNPPQKPAQPLTGFSAMFQQPDVYNTDVRAQARGALEHLHSSIKAVVARAADNQTRLHLKDLLFQIYDILNPKK